MKVGYVRVSTAEQNPESGMSPSIFFRKCKLYEISRVIRLL